MRDELRVAMGISEVVVALDQLSQVSEGVACQVTETCRPLLLTGTSEVDGGNDVTPRAISRILV